MIGELTPAQEQALKPFVQGKVVHDLGCGGMILSRWLIEAGADQVIAVDRYLDWAALPPRVFGVESYFHNYREPIDVAFISWPINWQSGLENLVARANTVIYLGSNLDGTACGDRAMWEHLVRRFVLTHEPDPKNTLIVYGTGGIIRDPLGEEIGALRQERIYSYEEVYGAKDLIAPAGVR